MGAVCLVGCRHLPSFATIFTAFSRLHLCFFCIFSCNNGCILADEIPTGFVKLLYSPTFTNISKFSGSNVVFCSKNFFRCSGSSNLLFLLCYSEWEFFLLQGFRDFPNKQAKMSVENCKNEKSDTFRNACYFSKCPTFYSACYSSKFTISPSFKKLFSELERVILPSFFSEL